MFPKDVRLWALKSTRQKPTCQCSTWSWKERRTSKISSLFKLLSQSGAWGLSGLMAPTSQHYNNCFGPLILLLLTHSPVCCRGWLYTLLLWVPIHFYGSIQCPCPHIFRCLYPAVELGFACHATPTQLSPCFLTSLSLTEAYSESILLLGLLKYPFNRGKWIQQLCSLNPWIHSAQQSLDCCVH